MACLLACNSPRIMAVGSPAGTIAWLPRVGTDTCTTQQPFLSKDTAIGQPYEYDKATATLGPAGPRRCRWAVGRRLRVSRRKGHADSKQDALAGRREQPHASADREAHRDAPARRQPDPTTAHQHSGSPGDAHADGGA